MPHSTPATPSAADATSRTAIPVSPILQSTLDASQLPLEVAVIDRRTLLISLLAVALGLASAAVSQVLGALIAFFTNLSFYGQFSLHPRSPAENQLGPLVLVVPVLGALVVGVMARYGSRAIRGHGIPEAMEQVLTNQSRIPPRITILKPLSAAIAIGTGGPFGAEGPIIATGGALGSVVGQILHSTAAERKTLLAAGAAAGMAATFGSPVSAVLLAVELLLFELRPQSLIPVSLACVTATVVRYALSGSAPVFPMPELPEPGGGAMCFYVLLGLLIGLASVGITKLVYAIEDRFEELPIHWMYWPALGAVVVGIVGYFAPRTLGVGYDNIEQIVSGHLAGSALLFLCLMKFISWSIYLGSGTSGGTLAPLFTIGGGLGAVLGGLVATAFPELGVDPRIAALVGMAAIFAGASRALLASVVFAFETTRSMAGLLPLLGGCTASYLLSAYLMRTTIMTEKIVRRGVRVPAEYSADFLDGVLVREVLSQPVVSLRADETLREARAWLQRRNPDTHHQGFPIVDTEGALVGVLTRRDLLDAEHDETLPLRHFVGRAPVVAHPEHSLRQAADHMVRNRVGRLAIVERDEPTRVIGVLTRSDLLSAHRRRLDESHRRKRTLRIRHALGIRKS